jgi:hypothetical protein
MSSWQWTAVIVVVIGTLLPNWLAAQSQPPATQNGQPDRVSVAYVPPNNFSFQGVYDLLRQRRRALEKVKEILGPFRFTECGAVNSYYQRKNFKPTVTICYEFLKRILELLPNETTPAGLTPTDAAVGHFLGDFP